MLHSFDVPFEDPSRPLGHHVQDVGDQMQQPAPVGPRRDDVAVKQDQTRLEELDHAEHTEEAVQRHVVGAEPNVVHDSRHPSSDVCAMLSDDAFQARDVIRGQCRYRWCYVRADLQEGNGSGFLVAVQKGHGSLWFQKGLECPVARQRHWGEGLVVMFPWYQTGVMNAKRRLFTWCTRRRFTWTSNEVGEGEIIF